MDSPFDCRLWPNLHLRIQCYDCSNHNNFNYETNQTKLWLSSISTCRGIELLSIHPNSNSVLLFKKKDECCHVVLKPELYSDYFICKWNRDFFKSLWFDLGWWSLRLCYRTTRINFYTKLQSITVTDYLYHMWGLYHH